MKTEELIERVEAERALPSTSANAGAPDRRRFIKTASAGALVSTISAAPVWGTNNGSGAVSGASPSNTRSKKQ